MGYMKRLLPLLVAFDLVGPHSTSSDRWLPLVQPSRHFVETFGGDGAVSCGLSLCGYLGCTMDLRLDGRHDILTPVGFMTTLALILGVATGGMVWFAPPCSTWVWMSRASTKRSDNAKGPAGDESNPNVYRQNCLVGRICYMIALCYHLGINFVIEQPSSSVMFKYSRMKKLLDRIDRALLRRKMGQIEWVCVEMGCWTLEMAKPLFLVGWGPHLADCGRRMSTEERHMMKHYGHKKDTAFHWTEGGKKRSRGGPDLKSSQSYPIGFGCHHALHFSAVVPLTDPSEHPHQLLDLSDTESDSSIEEEDPCLADIIFNKPSFFSGTVQQGNEMKVGLK